MSRGVVDVAFYDRNHGIAVGGGGPYSGGSVVLRTSDAGVTWTPVSLSSSPGMVDALSKVVYADSNVVLALGSYYYVASFFNLYRSTDGGMSWKSVRSFMNTPALHDVSFTGSKNGFVVGTGIVLHTSDAGETWETSLAGLGREINGVSFGDSQHGLIVGNGGLIIGVSFKSLTGVEKANQQVPQSFYLAQNYPNPFNPSTTIQFTLPCASLVSLRIFDLLGREVVTLLDQKLNAGDYVKIFDAGKLPSGVYFCRLQTEDFIETRKLLLLR